RAEMEESEKEREELEEEMFNKLRVMKDAVKSGVQGNVVSSSGLIGGDACRLLQQQDLPGDALYHRVIIYALATAEVNAGMGKIVAGPTAGSAGIIPGVVLALGEELRLDDRKLVYSLFTAAGLGEIVARKATLSGAAGGCQAECGVASAMAAGAAVELAGGSAQMVGHAFALALKNLLGLSCDPVAGLVEIPCVKRNAFGASHALTAATMALGGVRSLIPVDEVLMAMYQTGKLLPSVLKETSRAGLAITPTACRIGEKLSEHWENGG
ncbi:MAG TPA: L-serine ammonia-lyase, iron-sulfur-dependent, subunit alpha, partial [Halanaerobiales bacterium]|nr:L-serine ammonia-lyase, iron-sulfur-dependent, subunit alpha [Halanaerobiales bacterium]